MHVVSDDERREEARRLRECKSHIDAAGWFWLNDELGGAHVVASSEELLRRGTAHLADLIEQDDPPYNLYTLYETVLHRSPRCWECVEDDEVDELIDALLDICNAPGHERIQRFQPTYPDATAIYKGWRAEVYDPDGVLVSPSNLAVDLVRAHEYGKGLGIDREALMELADEMEGDARYWLSLPCDQLGSHDVIGYARRIREACGEVVE